MHNVNFAEVKRQRPKKEITKSSQRVLLAIDTISSPIQKNKIKVK